MEFNKEELSVIYAMLEVCINSLEIKKGHKSKKDIIAIKKMKKISNKINNYMEEK